MKQGQAKNTKARRNKLIQLIHIGKARLCMDEYIYRDFLESITNKTSCSEMTIRQLESVMRLMRKYGVGFEPRRVKPEEKGMATTAQLEYIKGMWAKCARNKSDRALRAFVKRITHVDALRFLDTCRAQEIILALRDMMYQAGFDPDTSEPLSGACK